MPKTKVTPDIAAAIKAAHAEGLLPREIAAQCGIHIRTVWRTLANENCKPRRALADRFYEKVDRDGPNGCHVWTGATANGYGRFAFWESGRTRSLVASRVAYELAFGPVPAGYEVRHKCDNPPCVNPEHLELGSHQENMNDMLARRRHAFGTVHGEKGQNALNAAKASKIREAYARGLTQLELSQQYGVSTTTIFYVVTGERWKSAPGPITPKGQLRYERLGRKPKRNRRKLRGD